MRNGLSLPRQEDFPWWYWGSDYPKEQWPLLGKPPGLMSGDANLQAYMLKVQQC